MPRPKKTELSKAVNPGTKRGNPDFVSSSFYVPKQINLRFDRSILTLKANGFEVDRSDILTVLMAKFNEEVEAAEKQDDGEALDLETILNGFEGTVPKTAALTYLKNQVKAQRERELELVAELKKLSDQQSAATERLEKETANLVESMLQHVPEDLRAPYATAVALMKGEGAGSSDQAE